MRWIKCGLAFSRVCALHGCARFLPGSISFTEGEKQPNILIVACTVQRVEGITVYQASPAFTRSARACSVAISDGSGRWKLRSTASLT